MFQLTIKFFSLGYELIRLEEHACPRCIESLPEQALGHRAKITPCQRKSLISALQMGCSTFSSPWMRVIALPAVSRLKLIKSAIWKQRGHRRARKSCPCPFHSSVSGKPARSRCELAMPLAWQKVTRKSRALSRSRIFGIVPVPSSIPATAGHHRHDGHLGSLAPEPSLPCCYLSWQESPQPVSAVEIFKAA